MSGAPKRAMEIIDELEPIKRGIYAGSVGYIISMATWTWLSPSAPRWSRTARSTCRRALARCRLGIPELKWQGNPEQAVCAIAVRCRDRQLGLTPGCEHREACASRADLPRALARTLEHDAAPGAQEGLRYPERMSSHVADDRQLRQFYLQPGAVISVSSLAPTSRCIATTRSPSADRFDEARPDRRLAVALACRLSRIRPPLRLSAG